MISIAGKENRKCQIRGSILNKMAKEYITEKHRSNTGLGKVCRCLEKGIVDRRKSQHEVPEAGVGWSHWLFAPIHSETPSQSCTGDCGSIIWSYR